jgi:hypothetical protein
MYLSQSVNQLKLVKGGTLDMQKTKVMSSEWMAQSLRLLLRYVVE